MSIELHIDERWRGPLAAAGLDTFDALIASEAGTCVSTHDRGQTYRIELPGETVFLKRDTYTSLKDILTDLCSLRRPEPPCAVELAAIRRLAALGVPVPEPIAWGRRSRLGLPWRAVLVMRPLGGTPLSELLRSDRPEETRLTAMRAAGDVAGRIYGAGISWVDLAPKHFFIPFADDPAELPGVLDLARMRPTTRPLKRYLPGELRRFCSRLRARGGTDADEAAFIGALNARLERSADTANRGS